MFKSVFKIAVVSYMVLFVSCERNEDPKPLTKEEAQQVLNSTNISVSTMASNVMESSGLAGIQSLMELPGLPFEVNLLFASATTDMSVSINPKIMMGFMLPEKLKSSSMVSQQRLILPQHAGTYTWNPSTRAWIYTSNLTNKIVIKYPKSGSQTNNCVFTIHSYSDFQININGKPEFLVSSMKVDLYVNNTLAFDLDFNATYNQDGDPITVIAQINLVPYSASINFSATTIQTTTEMRLIAQIREGNRSLISGDVTLSFKTTSSVINGTNYNDEVLTRLTGWVQVDELKANINVNAETLFEVNEPTSSHFNDAIRITLHQYPSNAKIADVRFVEDAEMEISIVLQFADGSQVPAEEFFSEWLSMLNV